MTAGSSPPSARHRLRRARLPLRPHPRAPRTRGPGARQPVLPIVALVGRANVGKSTLFNALTGTRDAIVADVPGVTRDRQYGYGRTGDLAYVVIDTGGLIENPVGIEAQMRIQTCLLYTSPSPRDRQKSRM